MLLIKMYRSYKVRKEQERIAQLVHKVDILLNEVNGLKVGQLCTEA